MLGRADGEMTGSARPGQLRRRRKAMRPSFRISSGDSDKPSQARSSAMCSVELVPVSGTMPSSLAKRNTTWASVPPERSTMAREAGVRRSASLAVSSENA